MAKKKLQTKKQKSNKKRRSTNTRKCTSNKDIITMKSFTKKSKIVKFQPNPTANIYNCYEKDSLAKYIVNQLNRGVELHNIQDITTRIPFGVGFLCTHFIDEIFEYIEQEYIPLLEIMTEHEDGRIFESQLNDLMNTILEYEIVWLATNKTRYTFVKKSIYDRVKKILGPHDETNFEERVLEELESYFDYIELNRNRTRSSTRSSNRSSTRSSNRSNSIRSNITRSSNRSNSV